MSNLNTLLAKVYVSMLEKILNYRSNSSKRIGVTITKRRIPYVVSLTSIPTRLNKVHLSLESLLDQSEKPDFIILWLSEEITSLPESILRLEKRGIKILLRKDIGPFTKEIYTLREFPDSILITADDDLLYPNAWLEKLISAYRYAQKVIHCHISRLMQVYDIGQLAPYRSWPKSHGLTSPSILIFPLTGPGALFPPGSLHSDVVKEDIFLSLCPTNDDIWMKSMSLLLKTPCKTITPSLKGIYGISGSQSSRLISENINKNDEYLSAVFNHYNLTNTLWKFSKTTN